MRWGIDMTKDEIEILRLRSIIDTLASAFKLVLTKTSISGTESAVVLLNEVERLEKSALNN